MDFQDLKKKIKSEFQIEIDISTSVFGVFNDGTLFRNQTSNDYCFLKKYEKSCRIYFFKSDYKQLDDIEDDYLSYAISFKIKEGDYFNAEKMIDWFV